MEALVAEIGVGPAAPPAKVEMTYGCACTIVVQKRKTGRIRNRMDTLKQQLLLLFAVVTCGALNKARSLTFAA